MPSLCLLPIKAIPDFHLSGNPFKPQTDDPIQVTFIDCFFMTTPESQSRPGSSSANEDDGEEGPQLRSPFKMFHCRPQPELRFEKREPHGFVFEAAAVPLAWTPQTHEMPPCKEWLHVSKFSGDRIVEGSRMMWLGLFNQGGNAFKYNFWGLEVDGGVEMATFKRAINDEKLVFREVRGSLGINVTLDPQDTADPERPPGSGRQTIRANLMSGKEIYSFKAEADTKVFTRELANVILPLLLEENIATQATAVKFLMGDKLMKGNMLIKRVIKNSTPVSTESDSSTWSMRGQRSPSSCDGASIEAPSGTHQMRKRVRLGASWETDVTHQMRNRIPSASSTAPRRHRDVGWRAKKGPAGATVGTFKPWSSGP